MKKRIFRRLSGAAVISLLISLTLCYVLVSNTIKSRVHIEEMYIEQLILEKSLEINNLISKLVYKNGIPDDFDKVAYSLVNDPAIRNILLGVLDIFDKENLAYKLSYTDHAGTEQIIASNAEFDKPGSRITKKSLDFLNVRWHFQVFSLQKWYEHLENDILVVIGLLVSFLVMFIMQNNFELKNMKSTLEHIARTDALTGIYNRRYMEENMKQIIKASSRSGSTLSLLMIDVDFFKKYNDTYGHDKGDICLKKIAETIVHNLFRDDDFVARFGGEEFVVALPNTNEAGARSVSERLLKCIRDCNIPHEDSITAAYVTISIGVTAGKVEHTCNVNDLVRQADKALYMSKNNGRNKYTYLAFEKE